MSVIEVHHLSKQYASWKKREGFLGTLKSIGHREKMIVDAVRDLSFSIEHGEFVGFIGPNGAGKTTTLKMLSGILWPSGGEATVLGYTPWKREKEFQRQFAIVLGQKNQLWWDLPAKDSFLLNKAVYEIPSSDFQARLKQFGDLLNVTHLFEIPVNKLSLGERMKCELVNSLLHNPRVLFLDEPTIGLDVVSQKGIRDFLLAWNREQGTTIILTSHAMADVEALCPRVLVIDHGTLQYDGALEALMRRVADHKELTIIFEKPVERKEMESLGTIEIYDPLRVRLNVDRSCIAQVAKICLERFAVSDLLIEEVSVDEVVRRLFMNGRATH